MAQAPGGGDTLLRYRTCWRVAKVRGAKINGIIHLAKPTGPVGDWDGRSAFSLIGMFYKPKVIHQCSYFSMTRIAGSECSSNRHNG